MNNSYYEVNTLLLFLAMIFVSLTRILPPKHGFKLPRLWLFDSGTSLEGSFRSSSSSNFLPTKFDLVALTRCLDFICPLSTPIKMSLIGNNLYRFGTGHTLPRQSWM